MSDAPLSLLHAVRRWLDDGSDCEAVVHGDHRLSYRALAARALALADTLRARGIRPGDRVAVLFTPRPEALVTLLGTWLAGATWLGINPRFKRPEQRQNLTDSGAKLLIALETVGKTDLRPDLDAHAADLGIDTAAYAAEMFAAKSDVSAFSDAELLRMDSKAYEVAGTKFRVSVLETTSPATVLNRKDSLVATMPQVAEEDGVDQVLLFVVDILNEESTLLVPNDLVKTVAEKSFATVVGDADTVVLPGVVSRKKQIIPNLRV